ncbi:MAG: ribonuclease D [Gammaproteobacteria bacterium]|nr:ribonuclease D [Gammaproteobacteria bacterium]
MIASNEALREHCERWATEPALGIDTEFLRTRTYYAKPGLIQVSDADGVYLVDPIAIDDFEPLAKVLGSPSVTKIFHSGEEDLALLARLTGTEVWPIFDTQIAAALTGLGFSMSYQAIVNECFEIALEKGETRSDWMQRPLTDSQCHYAEQDVVWLIPLFDQFNKELDELGRLPWLEAECRLASEAVGRQTSYDITRFRNAWQLTRRKTALLAALIVWREALAQTEDRPRGHILSDEALFAIAAAGACSKVDLDAVPDKDVRPLKRHRAAIAELETATETLPDDELPDLMPKPFISSSAKGLVRTLRTLCEARARELSICPELLAQRRQLEAFIRSVTNGEASTFKAWQQSALEDIPDAFARDNADALGIVARELQHR